MKDENCVKDGSRLKDDFYDILRNKRVKPVFQPIVSLANGSVIGYEGLSRIVDPKMIATPDELFNYAGMYGEIWKLEQLCRIKILEKFHSCNEGKNTKIFINVNPRIIHDKGFHAGFTKGTLSRYEIPLKNVVYEITERNSVDDIKGFKDTIKHYKTQGYTIAVDDAGSCYSGLNLICDIAPHYLKLDITLIRGINEDKIKKAMVKSLVEFANLTGSQLIAEGIETADELKTLLKLGVHNGQGFFLAKPDEELKDISDDAKETIEKYWRKRQKKFELRSNVDAEYRVGIFRYESNKAFYALCERYGDSLGEKISAMMKNFILNKLRADDQLINIGDDGFLVVFSKDGYKSVCEKIISTFNAQVRQYYSAGEMKNGYIEVEKKNHDIKKYPLVSIKFDRLI